MSIFGLIKDIALLPVDVAKDVITLGGIMCEKDEQPAVSKRADSMKKNLDETYNKEL